MQSHINAAFKNKIARRYIVVNSFDGILTTIGIIVGIYAGGIADPKVIIIAVVGAAIALCVSGIFGGYLTEEAEKKGSLARIERSMLKKLSSTKIEEKSKKSTIVIGLANGLAPAFASLIIISPAFFAALGIISEKNLLFMMIGIAFIMLAVLGVILGRRAKDNILKYVIKTVIIGAIAAVLTSVISFFA